MNYSDFLSGETGIPYQQLSKLFSTEEGITIEQYIIRQKIERIKELITYDEMNLSEIAYTVNYSSVAHLSSQFKKVVGMTPTSFKNLAEPQRLALDSI